MTTHAHLPRVDSAGVVVCGECGEPLELRCAKGHDPLPIGIIAEFSMSIETPATHQESAPAAKATKATKVTKATKATKTAEPTTDEALPTGRAQRTSSGPRAFEEKQCACGETFTPTSPNAKRCPSCRGVQPLPRKSRASSATPVNRADRPRTFPERRCGDCSQTFTPTGPAAKYCESCANARRAASGKGPRA